MLDKKDPDSITSSAVDDVFFILKSAARRSMSTLNHQILIATLSSIGMALDQELLTWITNQLHIASGTIENKEGRLGFMVGRE